MERFLLSLLGIHVHQPTHEWLDMDMPQSDIVNEVVQIRPPDL